MPDTFSSDYASSNSTSPEVSPIALRSPGQGPVKLPGINEDAIEVDIRTFGFEPERYGLGKPKRIVIRGKISSE